MHSYNFIASLVAIAAIAGPIAFQPSNNDTLMLASSEPTIHDYTGSRRAGHKGKHHHEAKRGGGFHRKDGKYSEKHHSKGQYPKHGKYGARPYNSSPIDVYTPKSKHNSKPEIYKPEPIIDGPKNAYELRAKRLSYTKTKKIYGPKIKNSYQTKDNPYEPIPKEENKPEPIYEEPSYESKEETKLEPITDDLSHELEPIEPSYKNENEKKYNPEPILEEPSYKPETKELNPEPIIEEPSYGTDKKEEYKPEPIIEEPSYKPEPKEEITPDPIIEEPSYETKTKEDYKPEPVFEIPSYESEPKEKLNPETIPEEFSYQYKTKEDSSPEPVFKKNSYEPEPLKEAKPETIVEDPYTKPENKENLKTEPISQEPIYELETEEEANPDLGSEEISSYPDPKDTYSGTIIEEPLDNSDTVEEVYQETKDKPYTNSTIKVPSYTEPKGKDDQQNYEDLSYMIGLKESKKETDSSKPLYIPETIKETSPESTTGEYYNLEPPKEKFNSVLKSSENIFRPIIKKGYKVGNKNAYNPRPKIPKNDTNNYKKAYKPKKTLSSAYFPRKYNFKL